MERGRVMTTSFLDQFNKEDAQKLSIALSQQYAILLTAGVSPSFKEEMRDELATRHKVGLCVDKLAFRTTMANKWYRTFNATVTGIEQLSCDVEQMVPNIIEADPFVVFFKLPNHALNLLVASSLMDNMAISPVINVSSVEYTKWFYKEMFVNPDSLQDFSSPDVAQYYKDCYLRFKSQAFAVVPSSEEGVQYGLESVSWVE